MKPDSRLCLQVAVHLVSTLDDRITAWKPCDDPKHVDNAREGQKLIDLAVWTLGGLKIALEHTTIEAYENQLHEGRQITHLLPLQERLAGQLPTDRRFNLTIALGTIEERIDNPEKIIAELEEWILIHAHDLPAGNPTVAPRHRLVGDPPETPIEVTLSAWPANSGASGGNLRIMRSSGEPADVAERRITRFDRALSDKLLGKLLEHQDAYTVLVLEDLDTQMSNISDNYVALRCAATQHTLSDAIVVVETPISPALGYLVFRDGCWNPDFAGAAFELPDVNALIDLEVG